MTLNKTHVSVWTAFIILVGGFTVAEYCHLKAQPSNLEVVKLPASRSLSTGFSCLDPQKSLLDYTQKTVLQNKNSLLNTSYSPVVQEVKAGSNAGQAAAARKKKTVSSTKRRRGRAQRRVAKSTPLQKKSSLRRRRTRALSRPLGQESVSYRSKSSPLKRKPLKNVTVKVTHIRPATAHASWKKLQREPLFAWPVESNNFWISSLYGPRRLGGRLGFHAGVDMAAPRGTPVYAADAGIIVEACYSAGYGNYILIAHNRKFKTRYAHLDKILVHVGQNVCSGDCIGRVGATGFVRKSRRGGSAPHLHFEVYMKGKPVNPFFFLA